MNIISKFFLIVVVIIISLVGCTKGEGGDNKPEPKEKPLSIEGFYIGETYQKNKWQNPMNGYQEWDTTFIDTFSVILDDMDSISFINKNGREWKFELETTNKYMEFYGTHSYRMFKVKPYDSLIVKYWSYGGDGDSFNQSNIDFIGTKQ